MTNPIDPQITELAASGSVLNLSTVLEFDAGEHAVDRMPLVTLMAEALAYDQMIPFALNIAAGQTGGVNLWTAPSQELRARAICVACVAGGGAVVVNAAGGEIPFPMVSVAGATGEPASPAFFAYVNAGGPVNYDDASGVTGTGDGIQSVTVYTGATGITGTATKPVGVEARFRGYVFI